MSDPLSLAREALAGERVWLVGGAVRDRLLGREVDDLDLAVDGDVRAAAKRLAKAARGPSFELSGDFGAWRVIAGDRSWQADLSALRGGSIDEDVALRDFTVNAMAEPLDGAAGLVDPSGGALDLESRILRAVGPRTFPDDPLRVLRLARLTCELDLEPDPGTLDGARAHAASLAQVSPERVFAELKRVVVADRALEGSRSSTRSGHSR